MMIDDSKIIKYTINDKTISKGVIPHIIENLIFKNIANQQINQNHKKKMIIKTQKKR